jgi:hypothetical protein
MDTHNSYTIATVVHTVSVLLLFAVLSVFSPFISCAFCGEQAGVPRLLQEWIPWALHKQEEKTCTLRSDDVSRRYCSWPSRLIFEVSGNGAVFRQEWLVETRMLVPLPGSRKLWPEFVKDAARNIIVIDHNGTPSIWLDSGSHSLSGRFNWEQLPEYIDIPSASGLVAWKSNSLDTPHMEDGKLWLKGRNELKTNELDQTSSQIFRKIQDTIPLLEDLHIILTVSGAPREITLGLMIKDGFLPLHITSPLPARMDQEGRLTVQARPGQWQIDMVIRDTGPKSPEKLDIGAIDGLWPESEVWVFEASPKFRQVTVENVPSIDPSRTALPANWLNLPAYLVKRQDTMILVEKSRGNPQTIPDRLALSRTLWLDEKGTGLTAQDVINGTMTKGWRLNAVPEQHLGKADVDGETQLITRLPDSDLIGVEVRRGNISLTADSRVEKSVHGTILTFPALGWSHPFQQLNAQLNLPPGWKLLASSGVDKVSTWLNNWTLLDIFLVLIISLATGKILGWGRGGLSLVALIIMYHQPESPRHLWLPLLALLAIGRKVTSERGISFIRIPIFAILLLLLLQSVPFMIREIRIGIFPQLEKGTYFQVTTDAISPAQKAKAPGLGRDAAEAPASSAGRMYSVQMAPAPAAKALPERIDKEIQIDPQAMIQTGPGLPNWHWQSLALTWNGPVGPDQKIRLILLSPGMNCILAFLRVGLLALLLVEFFRRSLHFLPIKRGTGKLAGKSFACIFFTFLLLSGTPAPSAAEIPSPEMLQELQDRLLASPDCHGECANLESCRFSVQAEKFRLDLTIHAAADTAVALPGDSRTFSQILVDNVPAPGIRTDSGTLLVKLSQGIHQVVLEKDMQGLSEFNLTFPLLPHRALTSLNDWTITGIHPDGTMEKQIAFKRIEQKKKGASGSIGQETAASDLKIPPFFQVERVLHLGLKWTVESRIIRRSQGNIITAEVPLIPGEMPTSESLYITDRKVQISLGVQNTSFSWQSVLPQGESVTLIAPWTTDWSETWYLDVSPIWHVTTTGIPEVSQTNPAGLRFPEYRPHPGESMTMTINRPEGVAGPTMTIDTSLLSIQPGTRATDSKLNFSLHASRGTRHIISLPEKAELQRVLMNDKEYPLQLSGNQLTLPIQPGKQQVEISWRSTNGIMTRLYTPHVDLGLENVNSTIHIEMPASRWILMTGGPRIGPAVLFWGEIVVIVLLAILLGRIRLTPLTTGQWLLLGMGLSQVNMILGSIVVGWLFILGIRKKKGPAIVYDSSFNLLQIVLVVTTICACISLIYAVQQGLLGDPDMQIGGNGSYGHSLHWYQDRNDRILPQAWVLSVPLLVYRIIMLAWALWLALALLRWLSWGWGCFSDGETWRKKIQQPEVHANGSNTGRETEEPLSHFSQDQSAKKVPPASVQQGISPQKKSWFRFRKKESARPKDQGDRK